MRLASFALMSGILLAPGEARAVPIFPEVIQTALNATEAPDCSVCHSGGRTGVGTVNTPFGTAMRARGLVKFDVPSLEAALAKMTSDKVDSNGDGVLDVEELRQGKDPNPAAGTAGAGAEEPVTYGCVGRVAPHGESDGRGGLAALGLLAVAVLARRRRGARSA